MLKLLDELDYSLLYINKQFFITDNGNCLVIVADSIEEAYATLKDLKDDSSI